MILQIKGIKEVFSKPYYIVLMVLSAFFFYLLTVVISDFSDLVNILKNYSFLISIKFLFFYFVGFPTTITTVSSVSMFIITLLFGSYISLAVYRTKQVKLFQDKKSILGTAGIFFGVFAPGCAACGIGLASLFGISGFIIALPFHGEEISFIAILLLGYANWSVAGKVNKSSCSINDKRF